MLKTVAVPRLMIGGLSSGSGKTTVMVALCRALTRRGLRVAAFKAGPDYLDPTYHARAARTESHNLDAWMMGRESVLTTFALVAEGADIALIEGVMGLFDGIGPDSEEGSSAQIAKWLNTPVLLVVDASGMARTIAALVLGCATFDPDLSIAGVLCNRVGSQGHLDLLRSSVGTAPVIGGLPKDSEISFPERHLGLHQADETSLTEERLDLWADRFEQWCDVDLLLKIARSAAALSLPDSQISEKISPSATGAEARCRIGYAKDEAFHFYYEDNLQHLRLAGAELIPFSPIHDRSLPDVDGLYLGGGYPEVHAEALAANQAMLRAVRQFAAESGPVYGECGGLMYLCSAIRTEGGSYPMVGLLRGEVVMRDRLQALGYVEVTTTRTSVLGPAGQTYRGHQFRYSELLVPSENTDRAFAIRYRRSGKSEEEGYFCGQNVLASYVHGHWASNPSIAENFVNACANHALSRSQASTTGLWVQFNANESKES
jgi:cobyrinic acid a,c-diamide synthase